MFNGKILLIGECYRECTEALECYTLIKHQIVHKPIEECGKVLFSLFDIIVLDCGHNVPLGLSILDKIKKNAPQTIVIFVAKTDSAEYITKAFRMGAREFIKKPVNILELRNTIKTLYDIKIPTNGKRIPIYVSNKNHTPSSLNQVQEKQISPIERVLKFINDNLGEDLRLEDLVNITSLSKYHFIRRFRNHTGFTPKEYIIFSRIEKAKEVLLGHDDVNIAHLAADMGFNYPSSFTKHFIKYVGCPPSQYKKSLVSQKE